MGSLPVSLPLSEEPQDGLSREDESISKSGSGVVDEGPGPLPQWMATFPI